MLFNSISFLIFLPLTFLLYWFLPKKLRPFILLGASCYFYMAFVPYYILILLYLITLDFFLAQYIQRTQGKVRLLLFGISIIANIGTLLVFKYFNFFNANIEALAELLHWNYSLTALSIVLPLGLSFHIFQSLAYIIEVYRGKYPPERNYFTYALYVLFFPQLVAGPIERPAQLLPQLKLTHHFSYPKAVEGMKLMLRGFFKKVVIGNNLAVMVDHIYAHSATADASTLLIGVVAFSFLLYADFSGYSDIAVGSAKLFGIDLLPNFNHPYFSRSPVELWRRWHISLSSWFRDYVYIPLGGSRHGLWRTCLNTLSVFTIMGLWHGAGWNFVVMGLLFGSYNVGQRILSPLVRMFTFPIWKPLLTFFQITGTFMLTTIAWIFFRATDLPQALTVLERLATTWSTTAFSFLRCNNYCAVDTLGIGRGELFILGLSVAGLLVYEFVKEYKISLPTWATRTQFRLAGYYTVALWILLFGHFVPKTFIYFQF